MVLGAEVGLPLHSSTLKMPLPAEKNRVFLKDGRGGGCCSLAAAGSSNPARRIEARWCHLAMWQRKLASWARGGSASRRRGEGEEGGEPCGRQLSRAFKDATKPDMLGNLLWIRDEGEGGSIQGMAGCIIHHHQTRWLHHPASRARPSR